MNTASSKGLIRKIDERKGEFWVSFTTHDGYFTTATAGLREKLRAAQAAGREVAFTYDRELNILSIE